MSHLCYLCLFGSSLPPVICRTADVLFMFFVFVRFVFTSCYLQEGLSLIYVICVCSVRLYFPLFVGGLMSYLCYLCFVRFVFTSRQCYICLIVVSYLHSYIYIYYLTLVLHLSYSCVLFKQLHIHLLSHFSATFVLQLCLI